MSANSNSVCPKCRVNHNLGDKRSKGEAPLLELDEWQRYVKCRYGRGPHCSVHNDDCEMLPWPCGDRIYWSCARSTVKVGLVLVKQAEVA